MEIDTGATVSLMFEATFKELWPSLKPTATEVKLCTYSGETIPVVEMVDVAVKYKEQVVKLPLLVVLKEISGVVIYSDDILVTGPTHEKHPKSLAEVLRRLEKGGHRVNKQRCQFIVPSVTYLGQMID